MSALPTPADVVANILAQIIVNASSWVIRSCADVSRDAEGARDPALVFGDTLSLALAPLMEVDSVSPELGGGRFRDFLRSTDLYNFLQRLFLLRMAEQDVDHGPLREEFLLLWALWVNRTPEVLEPHCDRIYGALDRAVADSAAHAVCEGVVATTNDTLQATLVANHLAAIERRLALLRTTPSLDEFHAFEIDYRTQIAERFSLLTPPHIDDARRVRIDRIYVDPDFHHRSGRSWSPKRVSLTEMRSTVLRTVLLGQPGGGKSTLTAKLCFDLARDTTATVNGVVVTPLAVVLRDYGQAKTERQLSIVDFIAEGAASDYQIAPPDGALEYMLDHGRALVVFDGLDELIHPARRKAIRDEIESFCTRYPAVRVLVTSREIGYDRAPLDPEQFTLLRLAEFDDDQLEAYVHRWFAAHPDVAPNQKRRQAGAFLRESASVAADLRRNALLLALMCNIYKGEGYIPTNRPAVYEKCSNMLLRRWDASRGIEFSRPLGAHLERTLQYLAKWMFDHADREGGVTEGKLLSVATDYLARKRFEDEDEARHEAANFLEFCKGRAWVLVEVGTSSQESLFQFAHRTFLEYFAADYLVRNSSGPAELWEVLAPKLGSSSWDVVAQLAFQIQNTYREDAGDELLTLTLEHASRPGAPRDKLAKLSFAIRALEFLVPAPPVTRSVASAALERVVERSVAELKRRRPGEPGKQTSKEGTFQLLLDLASIGDENVRSTSRALAERATELLADPDIETAIATADVLYVLGSGRMVGPHAMALRTMARELLTDREPRLSVLGKQDLVVGYQRLVNGLMKPHDFVEAFGARAVFRKIEHYVGDGARHASYADQLLWWSTGHPPRVERERRVRQALGEVGRSLRHEPVPWLSIDWEGGQWVGAAGRIGSPEGSRREAWGPRATFGLFCVLTPVVEMRSSTQVIRTLVAHGPRGSDVIAGLLSSRVRGDRRAPATQAMQELGWSAPEVEFADQWISGKVSVTAAPRRRVRRRDEG